MAEAAEGRQGGSRHHPQDHPGLGRQFRHDPFGWRGRVRDEIDLGPGYRVYYIAVGKTVVVLLCGGDKSTQQKDIGTQKLAKAIGQ